MPLTGSRTYVGFGFGAIQAGLFLYEAYHSGSFKRLVVAEVMPEVVAAVRRSGGTFNVNIARPEGVDRARIGPIEIDDPAEDADRQHIIDAIAYAEEVGTAIPSVAYYASPQPGSLHTVLAQGLRKKASIGGPRVIIYTAENNNHAAEILESKVMAEIPERERDRVKPRVRFLNTVIGKMSGIVTDADEIRSQGLVPATPEDKRAFLVESFNRILISKVEFDRPFQRMISVFEEKPDLLPFEEAKLYGHNAAHALAAYLGAARGVQRIADLPQVPGVMAYLRAAFTEESGESLIRKWGRIDPLFSTEGFARYADDLLQRMTNPYLRDTVERVGRDPARKLGWDDRLIGTIRLAISQNVSPRRYAFGTAAAAGVIDKNALNSKAQLEKALLALWEKGGNEKERRDVLDAVEEGRLALRAWIDGGFTALR